MRRVGVDACCLTAHRTGIANYVSALLEPLCRRHPDVGFFLYSNEAVVFSELPNVTVRISKPRLPISLWQNTQLIQMMIEDKIQVIWGTNGIIPIFRPGNVGTVVTIHDLAHYFVPATQMRKIRAKQRLLQPISARRADKVVAVSQSTADDIEKVYRRRDVSVIHPIVSDTYRHISPEAASEVRRTLDVPERFILTVGTLEPRKNIAALIQAYLSVIAEGVRLPQLVIAGARGWLDASLGALVEKSQRAGAVRYLGFVSNDALAGLYASCEAFIMPSLYEGFGMPILEAQLCGAPVVHGEHQSMSEAASGIGVKIESSSEAMRHLFHELSRGECALTCRIRSTIRNDASESADHLWEVMAEASQCRRPYPAVGSI